MTFASNIIHEIYLDTISNRILQISHNVKNMYVDRPYWKCMDREFRTQRVITIKGLFMDKQY